MDTINIGPLALPFGPLTLLIALLLASTLARLLAPVEKSQAESAVWTVFFGGVITARLTFVALYFDVYRHAPWSMPDIRDGGFHALSGILAALAIAIWLGWRNRKSRMPLMLSLVAGAAFWAAAGLFAATGDSYDVVLPELVLERLEEGETSLSAFIGRPTVVNLWAT
jgi:prolipoprotein diacylglyceryltransferase